MGIPGPSCAGALKIEIVLLQALVCRDNKARPLTKDHCASDPDEAARIKGSGGKVITDSIGRTMVNNRLAMSR